jgi:chromosome segregation ATPase
MFANKKDLELAQSKINSLESDLTALQSSLTEAQGTIAEQTETIAGLQNDVAAITAERDTLNASLTEAQGKVTALEADLVTANTSAEARAAEIVAQAGIPPVDVNADEQSPADHVSIMATLSPEEKTKYYNQHAKEIKSQLTK